MKVSILLCSVLLVLQSCSPVYIPAPPSAPLLIKQGDIAVSGNMSTGALLNLSAAYAFVDRFSGLIETTIDPSDGTTYDRKYYSTNAALGYTTTIGKRWRTDVFLGGGLGTGESKGNNGGFFFSGSDSRTRARFTNILGQFDIGLVDEDIEAVYQLRLDYVMFNRFERISEEFGEEGTIQHVNIEYGHRDMFYMEHSLMLRLGVERFKFLGFLNITNEWDGERGIAEIHAPVSLGVGFQFRLNAFE